jgi:uroporphyrinogen-III decarboxylase
MPIQHTCGYAQDLIEDFIDLGAVAWTPVQPTNDIVGLQKKYGDKITIIGGFDSNGPASRISATQEEIDAETKRCIDTYGPQGSYIFFGFRLINTTDPTEYAKETGKVISSAVNYSRSTRV